MINFRKFTSYTPDEDKSELVEAGVVFLRDENGNDWYECQKFFHENTIKIVYDSDNIVVSISNDVSTLWPVGASVAEIETLPDGADIDGNWIFDGENVVERVRTADELKTMAESRRTERLNSARQQLVISQTKLLRGRILSEDEQSALDAWLDYIDAVNALDFNTITDKASFNAIAWPTEPV
ncbi:tail fiber assembly protein [Escherichia coli]|uniref:tail fiber assembly protein n=1 Tax=Escherichia coli TaxID=562 RepID=UPI000BE54BCA|nr:tail fiber assembly protein [Escherichia coli]EAP9189580.1 tail assembly chaperone [Salmonella enterica]EHD2331280.1 tail fiber assembly protein [Salmonella enterica subsp. enterica serovar Lille]EFK2851614.1 tail fiber assembly protein [Escherichia coli]EGI9783502.1 tail fiber assembly protein [Salmonella enterica]EHA2324300.1 tail fiber assembly protein [Salmonella enterica]